MVNIEMLDKAIAAHGAWKARLRRAASNGTFDGEKANVKADNQCDFGKWLYGAELTDADKQSSQYRTVKELHAQFHREAARVVDLATSGQKDAAELAIGIESKYMEISSALTGALVKWRDSFKD